MCKSEIKKWLRLSPAGMHLEEVEEVEKPAECADDELSIGPRVTETRCGSRHTQGQRGPRITDESVEAVNKRLLGVGSYWIALRK
jgi:hypothetical protein